jgi:quercetin dioxygenase-like cupin family protein
MLPERRCAIKGNAVDCATTMGQSFSGTLPVRMWGASFNNTLVWHASRPTAWSFGEKRKLRSSAMDYRCFILTALLTLPLFGCQHLNTKEKVMSMNQQVMRKELLTPVIDGSKQVSKVEIQEVTMNVEIEAPLHLHPCPTMGVVTEGKIAFEIEGEKTQHLKAGDVFYEPANIRIAKFNNEGDVPAKFVVFYLLGEGESDTVHLLEK